jgi:uncharacterized repeat protein (TIGR01451 family)
MKQFILLFAFLIGSFSLVAQSGYWEEIPNAPGAYLTKLTHAKNGTILSYDQNNIGRPAISSDTGNTWRNLAIPNFILNTSLISLGQSGKIYSNKTASNKLVFDISADAGQTWTVLTLTKSFKSITDDGNGMLYGIRNLNSGGPHGIYKSANNGVTWDSVSVINYADCRNLQFDDKGVLWIYGYYNYYSFDQGKTWIQGNGLVTYNHSMIYTDANDSIYRRDENGNKLAVFYDPNSFLYSKHFNKIQLKDSSIILQIQAIKNFYFDEGINYRSTDDGLTWQLLPNKLPVGRIISQSATLAGKIPISRERDCVLIDRNLVSYSGSKININIDGGYFDGIIEAGDSIQYAFSGSYFLSRHEGDSTWTVLKQSFYGYDYAFRAHTKIGDEIFYLERADSSITVFNVKTQQFSKKQTPVAANFQSLLFGDVAHQVLYLQYGDFDNGYYKTYQSLDKGNSWILLFNSVAFDAIQIHNNEIYALDKSSFNPFFIYQSLDGGIHWNKIPNKKSRDLAISKNGTIFIDTQYSTDLGLNWYPLSKFPQAIGSTTIANNRLVNSVGDIFDAQYARSTDAELLNWTSLPLPSTGVHQPLNIPESDRFYMIQEIDDINTSRYSKLFRSKKPTTFGTTITGYVKKDADSDCSTPDVTDPLQNWMVEADNGTDAWYTNTDSAGMYSMFVDTGSFEIRVQSPLKNYLWEVCDDSVAVNLPMNLDSAEVNFPVKALADCPFMGIDFGISQITPCFESNGFIAYCNYGTLNADSAYIDVILDPLVDLLTTSIPADSLGGGVWRFQLGQVNVGACGNLSFTFITDCDSTIVGQSLCFDAKIHPDAICFPVQGWSGAVIQATATCVNDTSVRFEIKNIGNAASQPLNYIIVEDDVILRTTPSSILQPLDSKIDSVSMPAGHFLLVNAQQEPGYPFGTSTNAFSINCGAPTLSPTVLWYNLESGPISEDVECQIAVASLDPNDKTGLPFGYGVDHFIEANTDIEYTIRFQNTGTAAAHFVIIRDTLPAQLDPSTIRMGTGSHNFTWKMEAHGVIVFHFDNINLPDETTNEVGSHGFVGFKISQKPNLPNGTTIENRAAIYFDYNSLVQTNQTFHKIGHNFIEILANNEPEAIHTKIKTWPNPVTESALLTFENLPSGDGYRFILTDITGKKQREQPILGQSTFFKREGLPSGLYFFEIRNNVGLNIFSGKLMLY